MATGYTTAGAVALHLGVTLTGEQEAQAENLVATVTSVIDQETRRSWFVPPVTGEIQPLSRLSDTQAVRFDATGFPVPSALTGGTPRPPVTVYLIQTPVASIEQVQMRTKRVGDIPQPLVAGIDYELINPDTGEVIFAGGIGGANAYVIVDYTPASTAPPAIGLAATLLVAHFLIPALDPDRYGLAQYKLAEEIAVVVDDARKAGTIPDEILRILRNNRKTVLA